MPKKASVLVTSTLMIAVLAFLISFAISFQSWGLEQGLLVGEDELDQRLEDYGIERPQFAADGTRTYVDFAARYGQLSFLFFLVIAVSMALLTINGKRNFRMAGICFDFLSIFAILYILRSLIRDKLIVGDHFWTVPRNAFAGLTIHYDWILVFCAIVILLLQVGLIISMPRRISDERLRA